MTTAKFSLAALAATLLLGCGASDNKTETASGSGNPTAKASDLKIGVVFDSGGKGDKSFNDSAWRGVEKAQKELGISDPKSVESRSPQDFENNLSSLAERGCNVIFAVGVGQDKAVEAVAPKFPDVKFGLIDATVNAPNVRSVTFNEEQGSFLAGYAAALASKSGKVGFVGGMKIPLIEKFQAGYEAGARAARNDIVVLPAKYTQSWDDTATGKAMAESLFGDGADVVYHAAGRCGLGVISAARDAEGKYAIGVDSDQDDEAKGKVLTSMVKHVDDAVFTMIKDVQEGKFEAGPKVYDLRSGFVGVTDFRNTKDLLGPDGMKKLDAAAAKVKDGTYQVPTKVDEVAAFVAGLRK